MRLVDEDDNYLYYHFNNIGSTTAVTGEDGKIVHAFTYGTYGELLSGDTHGILFLYNGRYGVETDGSGLYYMRARYYNPEIKRFINQDVIEGNITNSPSLNKYAYCQGNPVSLLDPFGLNPLLNWDWNAIGHAALDLLGMVPGAGFVADVVNGIWYCAEGKYFEAAGSFVSAIPGAGDAIGLAAKGITGCTKASKAIKYATRLAGKAGNCALSAYSTSKQIWGMWDKYVFKGESWSNESWGELLGVTTSSVFTANSAKGIVADLRNYSYVKHDILTSQCFVEGTLVLTDNGQKPIEDIRPGDHVYASDPETGESGYKEVVQTFENETKELVHIHINGDEIVSTPTHPFYSPVRGWTSAVDLRAGDILVLSNGEYVIVEQVQHEILEAPVKVYNFEVQDFHTYYVGKNSVLVHNRCKLTDQEIDEYAKKYASAVNSNQAWSWKELSDGNKFSRRQKSLIRNRALESKLIPTVEMKPGTNAHVR